MPHMSLDLLCELFSVELANGAVDANISATRRKALAVTSQLIRGEGCQIALYCAYYSAFRCAVAASRRFDFGYQILSAGFYHVRALRTGSSR
jgi:hypothetical protein